MSKNLISPTQASFDLVDPQLTEFFSCSNLSGTDFKRKDLQTKLFWPPLISLKLLIRPGTQLSFTDYWLTFALLCLLDPVLSVRRKSKSPLPWCSKPLVSNRMLCLSGLHPWPSSLHPICRQPC